MTAATAAVTLIPDIATACCMCCELGHEVGRMGEGV
eukprot:CAMPEP_0202881574 /NCGR_PEP_ID=MMETSP1391-20130828/36725_1 /ASSEMBLY_ACC=CAM_ASM_000867 /TAXON_ID=1034604 /ORGANISM="Chlamydomonas leiostraca, Strain SAG 11-49" /LENGTH=35 /DNA_ID= /DNA_START= /DNA_END= /DNA_ORIENTATION=